MGGVNSNSNATNYPPLSVKQDSQNSSSSFHQDPNPPVIHPASSNNSNEYPLINNTPLQEVESCMGELCLSSNNDRSASSVAKKQMMLRSVNDHNSGIVLRRLGVVEMAKHPRGYSFLQKNIDEGKDVDMILSQVNNLNNVYELMIHSFSCLLIQKIFKAKKNVTLDNKVSLFFTIICDKKELGKVCKNRYGSRVIQNMLDSIEITSMMYDFVCAIKRITVELMINDYGNYVIMDCVKLFPPKCQKVILDEVARHCVHVATNRIGSIAIRKCLTHADREAMNLIVTEIVSNVMFLIEDRNGNYVLQYLIQLKLPSRNEEIIRKLLGSYVRLTMNKYASHVVVVLLEHDDAGVIVEEIIESNELLNVLQDCYGNFVVQKALQYSQACLYIKLLKKIIFYSDNLRSHPYGKMVLKKAHL